MFHRRARRAKRRSRPTTPPPGSAPGTMMSDPGASPPAMRLVTYGPQGVNEQSLKSPDELAVLLRAVEPDKSKAPGDRCGVVWLDVDGVDHEGTMTGLGEALGLHRLTVADIVNTRQRAKIEQFDGYLFVVIRVPQRRDCLETEQISICLGPHFVATFQESDRPADPFEPVRARLRSAGTRFASLGADYLAYTLLDAVIDGYFPILEELGDRLDLLEDSVLEGFDRSTSGSIHLIRRDLVTLRRAVWPLREAIGLLLRDHSPLVSEETRLYLRDCYDHTVQIIDLAESYRDVGAGLMEVYLSTVSNRLNEVMKVLTIIATIFIPLTFIVGVYGMNFQHMPELHWRYGYPLVWALMAAIAGGMLFSFWRRGWIGPGFRPPGPPPEP